MRLRTLVPFLLLLSACGTEPSEDPSFLRILTDGSYYMQSDPMYIALTNVSAYRLRFQPNFVLQHLTSSGWQPTGMGSGSSTWIILSPGQRYIQSWGLNASTPMGTARLEYLQIQILDSTFTNGAFPELQVNERRSNQFQVTAGNPF